jgi:hypothetical protein
MKQEDIIRMALAANASFETAESMFKFAALVAAEEREACAKLADEHIEGCEGINLGVGKVIRARGNT